MYKNIAYFKGLNALRFFAASLVVLHHTATIGKKDGLFDLCDWGLFRNGANAVNFFFVLSGFLITYLLLKEHEQSGTVGIKQFYLRRVRRIWPLYFLLIIIGTLLLPLAFGCRNRLSNALYAFSNMVLFPFLFSYTRSLSLRSSFSRASLVDRSGGGVLSSLGSSFQIFQTAYCSHTFCHHCFETCFSYVDTAFLCRG